MTAPTVSVIIPAYNAARTLPQTLAALASANPPPTEIVVVDDGSTDETADIARKYGTRVLRLDANTGAAAAKNVGARAAQGEILLFTDADILLPANIIARLAETFRDRSIDGIVGLLDENIPHSNFPSQFKNLWMIFTYSRFAPADRIGLFYTSIAAMRRQAFWQAGSFDENYRGASIAEDTEFGQRAWGQGLVIKLDPELRVVHTKSYSLFGVLREDWLRARALTLMRLRKRGELFFTSVPLFYQLAVPTLYLTLVSFGLALAFRNTLWAVVGILGFIVFFVLNARWLSFLANRRGILFAVKSGLFLPFDVFFVGLGMLIAILDFARGKRY